MSAKEKNSAGSGIRLALAWTLWVLAAAAVAYLLIRFVFPGTKPQPPRPTDTASRSDVSAAVTDTEVSDTSAVVLPPVPAVPPAPFPADLAAKVTWKDAADLTQWSSADAKIYDTASYPLYPGDFAEDDVPLDDDRWIVVLDPGHQSSSAVNDIWMSPYLDPEAKSSWVRNSQAKIGTRGAVSGIYEYQVTHSVAKKVQAELESRGFTVYLTKDDVDRIMTGPERAAVGNQYQADLVVSLHCDGYAGAPNAKGALAQVPEVSASYPDERLANLSLLAGQTILRAYSAGTGFKYREVQPITGSSAFNWSKSPSVLLELGFMTNAQDEANLISDSFQDVIAAAVADGISDYLCRVYAGVHLEELMPPVSTDTEATESSANE